MSYINNGNSFGFLIDDEDILTGYFNNNTVRKPRQEVDDDDELSDYVLFRLWLARQLALAKYEKVWG